MLAWRLRKFSVLLGKMWPSLMLTKLAILWIVWLPTFKSSSPLSSWLSLRYEGFHLIPQANPHYKLSCPVWSQWILLRTVAQSPHTNESRPCVYKDSVVVVSSLCEPQVILCNGALDPVLVSLVPVGFTEHHSDSWLLCVTVCDLP